jgi:hypothetical protein
MRFFEFSLLDDHIDETVGSAGQEYELNVFNIMKQSEAPGLDVGKKPVSGFSRYGAGDIEATLDNKPFNIEIKLNSKAQMGSGSIIYDRSTGEFSPSAILQESADTGDLILILATAKTKKEAIDAYLDTLASIEPVELHLFYSKKGVPFVASKSALKNLKSQKLLSAINSKLTLSADHIARLYNKKGVFYIQVGGAGLFYLGNNPFNLDVPKFEGEANIEIRLKPAGDSTGAISKAFTKKAGSEELIQARTVGLICAARFLSTAKSPFTLDDVDSINKLLGSRQEYPSLDNLAI